ncbi:SDR family oxidoreductase [Pseudonocardia sp. TRM90224]|uniref:SDR family oxidoreductase n=1 Tax=Pseudonocardia sp. TRM90224 TaxID=2812678 RepID=UPI001E537E54|nr:SDR family NAD(P)-dependent oxidoreductase [Pseudonocardia sp. TRM90224]
MDLQDRRVLITGASSGIGAAVARAAAGSGAKVALLARRKGPLDELAAELGGTAVVADITDDAAAEAAVDTAAEALGGLDALVNSAGAFTPGPVGATDPAVWRSMIDLNVVALLVLTRAAIPHLRAGTSPTIVNLSSMSGRRVPNALAGVYAATKHAVHAASEGLRQELGPAGIRVTTVAPGFVDTPIAASWPDGPVREHFEERLRNAGLDPAAVAAAVVHVLALPPDVQVVEYAVTSIRQ